MIQTERELTPLSKIEGILRDKPVGWKKHHKWQWGWQKFRAVVDFIGRVWPKNQ